MEEKNRTKLKKWLVYGGLSLLILFVIITSSIVYAKRNELDKLKKENERINEEIVVMI